MRSQENVKIIEVTTSNVSDTGIYCIKDKSSPGYKAKVEWFKDKINKGLKIKIAVGSQGKQLGFIEYIPSELAWRPIKAKNYLFIQCIGIFVKDARNKKIGSTLVKQCEEDAHQKKKSGVCVVTSDGPWMANSKLFKKSEFMVSEKLERFELMYKKFDDKNTLPSFINWTKQRENYKGWNLIYSDQCPWHEKSINDLTQSAQKNGIKLKIIKLTKPEQAQEAPSGFGTFSLIRNGRLIEDHYLSKTRFENILKQELRKHS